MEDLTLEVTRKCPMGCILCSSDGGEPYPNEFSLDELKNIIIQARSLGVTQISLSGGEPLTYPHILDICRYIANIGIEFSVYTSGNIYNKNNFISPLSVDYLTKLKETSVKEIVFSIHGSNSQTHDLITRRKGSFVNLLESIKNSKEVGLNIDVHFVPTKINFRDLPSIVSLIKNLGLSSLHILRFVPQGRGYEYRNELTLVPKEVLELRDILKELIDVSDIAITIGAHYNSLGLGNKRCTAGVRKATIRPDGLVFPCVGMKGIKRFVNSNNIKNDSLENIINKSYGFTFLRTNFYDCGNNSCTNCMSECTNNDCIAQLIFESDLEFKLPVLRKVR